MRAILAAVVLALAAAVPAAAQTFEVAGKVVDQDGKPVATAKLTVVNKDVSGYKREGTTDKRGNFLIEGNVYAQQNRLWNVTVEAPGLVPAKAHVVARKGDKTLYDEYNRTLGPSSPVLEIKVMGVGEIRIEFVMMPGTAAEATPELPLPAIPGGAPAVPDDPYGDGIAKARAGDIPGALEAIQKAVEVKGDDPERREFLSSLLLKSGKTPEALQQALKAVELGPDRASARMAAADAYVELGNLPKARAQLTEARKAAPEDSKVLHRLAWIANETGQIDEAIEVNEAIVKAAPGDTETWLTLGDLYNRKKMPERASEAFRKVTELDPANAYKTFFNLGALIENKSDLTEADSRKAMEAFRKAVEIKPDYALAWRHLGYSQLRVGDLKGAKVSLQKYLDLEPKASDAAEIRATVKSLP